MRLFLYACRMTSIRLDAEIQKEEEIVAELYRLGIRHLSRLSVNPPSQKYPPAVLIAELTRQPSSRVCNALIPLFLAHPGFSVHVLEALKYVNREQGLTLKFFYTAAVLLQRRDPEKFQGDSAPLPDYFLGELGILDSTPAEMLQELGRRHQQASKQYINWLGSYENAAGHLLRQWELEKRWNASPLKR
jgi:hypothetical protein